MPPAHSIFFPYRHLFKACKHILGIPLGVYLVWCVVFLAPQAQAMPRSTEELRAIRDKLTETPVAYGQIPAIYEPRFLSAHDAAMGMNGNEPVFIVFLPDGPKIFPQKIMVWHEVVNDASKGFAYSVTYSPLSGSVAAYERTVDSIPLMLDPQGMLYNANSVLIDRNTGSLWSQMMGIAFDGPLLGRGLKMLPVWWSTWELASRVYPTAAVLMAPIGQKKAYGRDPYGSYITPGNYYDDERIVYPLSLPTDFRLHPKRRVIGLERDSLLMAIDETYVREKKVVNFYMGPTPLVAFVDPRLNVVRIFMRTVWDKETLFRIENGTLLDRETQSTWNFDGQATSGKLQGAAMDEYFGIYAFWFAWAAFHPETLLLPGESEVPDSALVQGVR